MRPLSGEAMEGLISSKGTVTGVMTSTTEQWTLVTRGPLRFGVRKVTSYYFLLHPLKPERRTDERTNGRTDERTNGRTDERTNGRTDERTNGRTDERTNGRTDERTNGRTDERTNGRMNNFIQIGPVTDKISILDLATSHDVCN